ncbi:MAG: site-specific integrase [Gemmatimonadales bacterium]|nr:site-specific integrase [Gemmatimonadales bacterium]MBP9199178.1 site-specific integrase [Gemmatimonadales bacterium]
MSRGRPPAVTLGAFAREHITAKRQAGKVTEEWLVAQAVFLERALAFLGEERRLSAVTGRDVEQWIAHLRTRVGRTGGRPLSEGSVRHHLNALSNLYRRAQGRHLVPPGYNPVAVLMEKPSGRRLEAAWLEVPDAALLLEAARRVGERDDGRALPFAYELVATLLLTGGRLAEVLGLEVEDVSLERRTVTFRPNAWRRLKTPGARRVVPLWPQLEEILRPYLSRRTAAEVLEDAPARRLLFPGRTKAREVMLGDIQKSLDRVAILAGFRDPVMNAEGSEQRRDAAGALRWRGTIRSKMFRHTYCAARLQTLDRGAPVAVDTVRRELGHGSAEMVERVYGHLGQVRHRAEAVEYRIEQHRERLGERIAALTAPGGDAG